VADGTHLKWLHYIWKQKYLDHRPLYKEERAVAIYDRTVGLRIICACVCVCVHKEVTIEFPLLLLNREIECH
jgi:hypothetical protein